MSLKGQSPKPPTERPLQIPLPQNRPEDGAVDFGLAFRQYAPLIVVAAVVFVIDQWTKASISSYVDAHGGTPFELLGGKVLIDLVHNTGAAFGLFPNQTVLFNEPNIGELASSVHARFAGMGPMAAVDVRLFVENETAYLKKHMTAALQGLEHSGSLSVQPTKSDGTKRKAKSYPDNAILKFQ